MAQALLIAIRFCEGRYHGTDGWPPGPARLFQALMAGAARGATVPRATLDALNWLEGLPPPMIAAPRGDAGKSHTAFVPNNDLDAALAARNARDIGDAAASIRVGKSVRPILFNADAPILYCWPFEGDDKQATALCETATRLYQLGRGIDMAWADAAVIDLEDAQRRLHEHHGVVYHPSEGGGTGSDMDCPRPGTGLSLQARFDGMRDRFRSGGSNRKPVSIFVQPPKPLLTRVAYNAPPDRHVFSLREGNARAVFSPCRLAQAASLVAEVRDQAARRLSDVAPTQSDAVARYLVGRNATDADKAARVRIVPLPSIGHPHADMMIRRLAIYVPQSCPLRADDLVWSFSQVAWTDPDGVIVRELQLTEDDAMAKRYENLGRHWRSVTPLALAGARRRRIDPARVSEEAKGASERAHEEGRAVHAVRQALRHAGVGVSATAVHVQREPFDDHGERADSFAAGTRFSKDSLWHVGVAFATPVAGPLLLGDGRYLGLGLMRPDPQVQGVLAFTIVAGLADDADPALVARAARRAMLARMQTDLPHGQRVPPYVSGHEDDGSPARSGTHRHIAVVPDLPRRRFLYVAPSKLQRGGVGWREIRDDHTRVERALEGMTVLRAARAGRLLLTSAELEPQSDPLFAAARVWESVSEYRVTRHLRRHSDEEALAADAVAELDRIGWPAPTAAEVLAARRGLRGGLSGRLRLTFAAAQEGPLVIGRTAHKGGGLFAGCN